MKKSDLQEALAFIREHSTQRPKIGIILGSGLGPFAEEINDKTTVATATIPHYPVSTVAGHAGKWVFGEICGKQILAIQGRIHAYEGYSLKKVTFPIHLLAELGVEYLIVTNAAGGLNPNFAPGDLMLIVDHINWMFDNPLFGPNDRKLGPRFPDMSEPYNAALMRLAENTALELGIKVQRGVLVAAKGPSYESAAEIRMSQRLGGDAATMSTVPEVITAVYRGLKVLGISCITNLATGLSPHPLSHAEVTEVADKVKGRFSRLVKEIIAKIEL